MNGRRDRKPIRAHCIGDPHISDRHIALSKEAVDGTLKLVDKKRDADIIVVMGDTLDRHNSVKLTLQDMAIRWIKELSKRKPTFVLIGNHDLPHESQYLSDVHPFIGLEDWKTPIEVNGATTHKQRLYIVSKPMIKTIKGNNVLFMPYTPPGKFTSTIEEALKFFHSQGFVGHIQNVRDIDMVFAHQEFKGSAYGPLLSVKGDEWPENYPMVVSGHIHTRELLKKNILYTGSLYPVTVSESNDKGVVTLEYDSIGKILEYKTTRVVMEHKRIIKIKASSQDSIAEMVTLDRKGAKYIVEGTSDEIATVKAKVRGMNLSIAYNVHPVRQESTLIQGYDEILRKKVTDKVMISLLEEIVAH